MNKIKQMLNLQNNYKSVYLNGFYDNNVDFLVDLKEYLKENPNEIKEINILKDSIINGTHLNGNLFYLDYPENLNEANYIYNFKDILNVYLKNKEAAYIKAHKLFTDKAFYASIQRFKKKFINYELYINMLDDIYNTFNKENANSDNKYIDTYKNNFYKVNEEIIKAIYESNLSPFDFAVYNVIDYPKINAYVKANPNNQMCFEISKRENTLEEKVIELLHKIATGEIDFYEYYQNCKIQPSSLRQFASQHKLYSKNVSAFINQNSRITPINEGNELNAKLVINEIEVPLDIKVQAINAIKEIGAPLSNINYKKMIRRLINK